MGEPKYKYNFYSPEKDQEMNTRSLEDVAENTTIGKIGKTILWTSLGFAVVVGAIFTGLTLRARRFRNRTPYDSFSHAGDNLNGGAEYGVGI